MSQQRPNNPPPLRYIPVTIDGPRKTSQRSLQDDLARVLNQHGEELQSDTPDFVLASYLVSCLDSFHQGIRKRDDYWNTPN